MNTIKVGIIGGSGLDDPDILHDRREVSTTTPFGDPSDSLIEGTIHDVQCILLARHGRKHTIPPSEVPYRANIWALKEAGCTHILATTACGSLTEKAFPGSFVVLDQFIDRTTKRERTFYDGKLNHPCQGVLHIPMGNPFCEKTRQVMIKACEQTKVNFKPTGCVVTIEGPRFSTKAESNIFRLWGGDVINMSSVPEIALAKEAGLSYTTLAMVTDYDCWHEGFESVTLGTVLQIFRDNVEKAKQILITTIELLRREDWTHTIEANQAIVQSNNFASFAS